MVRRKARACCWWTRRKTWIQFQGASRFLFPSMPFNPSRYLTRRIARPTADFPAVSPGSNSGLPAPCGVTSFWISVPSFRAKDGHLVGLANMTPRVEVGGPLIKNKLNFSEDLTYEFRRDPVRGLTWPFNRNVYLQPGFLYPIPIHFFAEASAQRQPPEYLPVDGEPVRKHQCLDSTIRFIGFSDGAVFPWEFPMRISSIQALY